MARTPTFGRYAEIPVDAGRVHLVHIAGEQFALRRHKRKTQLGHHPSLSSLPIRQL